MGFEESASKRLRRYRREADLSLEVRHGIEETARCFCERLFGGLEYVAAVGCRSGFSIEVERTSDVLVLQVEAAKFPGPGLALLWGY